MLAKLRKPQPDRDRVVIIEETGLADIATVYDQDDQAVYAESPVQDYVIPVGDLKAYVGPSGRIWVLAADHDYVRDTERLAALEKSIVLRHVTSYAKEPEKESDFRIRDILLYALVFILCLGVIFK